MAVIKQNCLFIIFYHLLWYLCIVMSFLIIIKSQSHETNLRSCKTTIFHFYAVSMVFTAVISHTVYGLNTGWHHYVAP